jgi:hypothetical protein
MFDDKDTAVEPTVEPATPEATPEPTVGNAEEIKEVK